MAILLNLVKSDVRHGRLIITPDGTVKEEEEELLPWSRSNIMIKPSRWPHGS